MTITYNLCISHSWSYFDAYQRLLGLLDDRGYFSYENYAVPMNDPIHTRGYRSGNFDTQQVNQPRDRALRKRKDIGNDDHEIVLFYFAGHGHRETTGARRRKTRSSSSTVATLALLVIELPRLERPRRVGSSRSRTYGLAVLCSELDLTRT
jgi:hypothetical protein